MPLRYDPDWWAFMGPIKASSPPQPTFEDAQGVRDFVNNILIASFSQLPDFPAISKTVYPIPAYDGGSINVNRFASKEQLEANWCSNPQPAILFLHGGGLVCGGGDIFDKAVASYAATAGVQVWSVDYRLAPEHPFPAPLMDAWAALSYLHSYHKGLGIDQHRIGIMGESAGGGLAAGLALMARDRGLTPPIAKQILIQPMLDDRTVSRVRHGDGNPLHEFLVWAANDNALAWAAYLGGRRKAGDVTRAVAAAEEKSKEGKGVSSYAAPARATDLTGLPNTYIEVGSLDLFRNEVLDYAKRLLDSEVEVELQVYAGVPHAFEGTPTEVGKRAVGNKMRAMSTV